MILSVSVSSPYCCICFRYALCLQTNSSAVQLNSTPLLRTCMTLKAIGRLAFPLCSALVEHLALSLSDFLDHER